MSKKDLPPLIMEDRFAVAKEVLDKPARQMPDISPRPVTNKARVRRTSAIKMPGYVWDLLKSEAYRSGETQGVIILKGLKALGLPIDDEDLFDQRKTWRKK